MISVFFFLPAQSRFALSSSFCSAKKRQKPPKYSEQYRLKPLFQLITLSPIRNSADFSPRSYNERNFQVYKKEEFFVRLLFGTNGLQIPFVASDFLVKDDHSQPLVLKCCLKHLPHIELFPKFMDLQITWFIRILYHLIGVRLAVNLIQTSLIKVRSHACSIALSGPILPIGCQSDLS